MPITRTPIVDDSGSGQDGTVIDNAWKQELYGQIDQLVSGFGGADIPFNAANFTASDGGLWTLEAGDVALHRYLIIGKIVCYWLVLNNTSIAVVTPTFLFINNLPFFPRITGGAKWPLSYALDNGVPVQGFVQGYFGNSLYVAKQPAGVWAGSVNQTGISVSAVFELA